MYIYIHTSSYLIVPLCTDSAMNHKVRSTVRSSSIVVKYVFYVLVFYSENKISLFLRILLFFVFHTYFNFLFLVTYFLNFSANLGRVINNSKIRGGHRCAYTAIDVRTIHLNESLLLW